MTAPAAAMDDIRMATATELIHELRDLPLCPRVAATPAARQLYRAIQHADGMLNGTDDGLAGEMRVGSMHTIVQFLMDTCSMGPGSTFLDIGSGLGKPVLHVALHAQVQHALGIEVAHATWALAMSTLLRARDRSHLPTTPTIHYAHTSVASLSTLNPCTHVYMFDIGFTPEIYAHIANLISSSPTVQHFVCYHPRRLLATGLSATPIARTPARMSVSEEQHTAYVYRCEPSPTALYEADHLLQAAIDTLRQHKDDPAGYDDWIRDALATAGTAQATAARTRARRRRLHDTTTADTRQPPH